MLNIAGTDGCKAGWLCLIEDVETKRIGSKIFPTFAELVEALTVNVIAIDIPIGLMDSGSRACDVAARELLRGKRATSVFAAPLRGLLKAGDYATTNALSQRLHQKGVSSQAHAIYGKVAEVDDVLRARPDLRDRVIEVHPEVSFAEWNGSPIIEPKRDKAGKAIRRALIDAHFGADAFESVRHRYKRKEAADDDILDAFAALRTAERYLDGKAITIPSPPPRDAAGLPMRIVY